MKTLKINNVIKTFTKDGLVFTKENPTEDDFKILKSDISDTLKIKTVYGVDITSIEDIEEKVSKSKYLEQRGATVIIPHISTVTVPKLLVDRILEAEEARDEIVLKSYFNFWRLLCCNPDERVRQNLYWFLQKYGMTITKSGLFVAYRNVLLKETKMDIFDKDFDDKFKDFIKVQYDKIKNKHKKSPKKYFVYKNEDEFFLRTVDAENSLGDLHSLFFNSKENVTTVVDERIFTDNYTKTFTIRLGEIVTQKRELCDSNQENTCSFGLHVAGLQWLEQNNSFGNIPLIVLVNPADVVGIPTKDSYGKLRTCSYLPVFECKWENGELIAPEIEDGFEDYYKDYIKREINNNDTYKQQIKTYLNTEEEFKNYFE